jgi:hypothetical protein
MEKQTIDLFRTMEFIRDEDISTTDKLKCLYLDAETFDSQVGMFEEDEEAALRLLFKQLFKELVRDAPKWDLYETLNGDFVAHEELCHTYDITQALCNGEVGLSLKAWIGIVGSRVLDVRGIISGEFDESHWSKERMAIACWADVLVEHHFGYGHEEMPPIDFGELDDVEYGWTIEEMSEFHFFMYRMKIELATIPLEILYLQIEGTRKDCLRCSIGQNYFCPITIYRKLRAEMDPTDAFDTLMNIIHAMYNNYALASNDLLKGIEKRPLGI